MKIGQLIAFLRTPKPKKIGFLTGAGVSVAAGIPDFRSPGGLYDTLRPDLLTATPAERSAMAADPVTVVCWDLFQRNQLPYLEVRRPFILGIGERKWRATAAHWFANECHKRNMLSRVFSQNIDGLDFQTDIPPELIVGCHGTIAQASCEFCGVAMPFDEFRAAVAANVKDIYAIDDKAPATSTGVACKGCGKMGVKPDTVLYGRGLPKRFFECMESDLSDLDVLFVAGTALAVSPANLVVREVPSKCIRVVVNREPVGQDLGLEYNDSADCRDVFLPGECDDGFIEIAKQLGWLEGMAENVDKMAEASSKRVTAALDGGAAHA